MAYSPAAHNTATAGRAGFVRLGSGVSGNADGSLVSNATLLGLTKSSVGLNNVENTQLSTWAGSSNITTVGTLTGGSASKSFVGLGNVENTQLSTWAGSSNITTLGTVTVGSAPASDVYSWAKQSSKPTYTKSEVGLGSVENTQLSTWAGSSNITTLGTVTSGSAPASDVYSWAKAATKPSYTSSEVGLGNVGNYTVNQNVGTGNDVTFNNVTAAAFYYSSDETLKTNINNLTNYWEILDKLRPVSFDWILNGKKDLGLLAQDVQGVLPESVKVADDGTLAISSSGIIANLVAAVKDLKSQVDELTKQLKG